MVLRIGLDLDQQNSAIRQLLKFVGDLEELSNPTECGHVLEEV
jgi:hypothetical protein